MPSNHLILLSPSPPAFNLSQHQGLSNESVLCIRWPKDWRFSFSISPSNEYSVLISVRMDWLDLLAVQWTLKSLVQHHSSKASILQHSAFFLVQLSHPYMTTGKTIALTRWTFVDRVMSLLFNMLQFSSVQYSVMSDSLRPHESQHARPPCPSPTPGVHPNPCHWVGDAIQPSYPLLSPSPPALNLSQHQGLFQWVSSSHQVAKVLEFQLQHQSFQWISRTDFL